jgi:hypothetical protein
MRLPFLFTTAILAGSISASAQTDTIFVNGQKISCTVKEVTEDAVKYVYPNEDLVNTVYKNGVAQIKFKSGRVQVFAEATSFKRINAVEDYDNVTVTAVETEVKGLFKIGDVSSKAKGTTVLSNQERVKDRAYRKLKIQAAMMGANIVYLTNQRTEGNKYGGYFQSGSSAETNLTGVSYSNVLPNAEELKKVIDLKKEFGTYEKYKLGASDSDYSKEDAFKSFIVTNIQNDNGIVSIEGKLEGENRFNKFRLAGINADHFSIFYQDKGTVYNYSIKL